jgi:hypothetical protein
VALLYIAKRKSGAKHWGVKEQHEGRDFEISMQTCVWKVVGFKNEENGRKLGYIMDQRVFGPVHRQEF